MVGGQHSTAVASDAVNDLALIEVPGDRGAVAPLRPTAARLGEGVTIAGFPLEGLLAGLSVTSGNVSRLSIKGGVLRAFLDAHAVGYSTATGTQPLADAAIATQARQFTVLVQCGR
jgi:hypothetical protein